MRVGIDASPLAVRFGGISRYTDELLRGFSRVDSENEYVLYGLAQGAKPPGLETRFSGDSLHFPLKRWVDRVFLPGAVKKLDLYHGTNYVAPLLHRFPTVLTIHDLTVYLFPESHPRARRMAHRLLPTLCRSAARIIVDSLHTKRDLARCYGIAPEQMDVVYLAAGEEFKPIPREDEDLQRARTRYRLPEQFVLYLGSIEERKNLPLLIRTMAGLRRDGLPQRLVIAGDGDPAYMAALRELAARESLDSGEDIVITGNVDPRDLPSLYNLCDLFVYPSRYEGFGLPPLEAMACGTPTVVPQNSSFLELYEGAAVLTELDSEEHLAEAIRRPLSSTTLREELVEQGLKLAGSRSWDDTAVQTLRVYRQALEAA